MKPRLGLDLQGGLSVVYTPKNAVKQEAIDKAIEIIRNRVDALGVAEPDISRQGPNILVQLPGVKDPNEALKAIGTTAEMRFRPVIEEISPGAPNYATTGPNCTDEEALEQADADPTKEAVLCARSKTQAGLDAPREQWPKLRVGPTALLGNDISSATAEPPAGNTLSSVSWDVSLNLTNEGSKKFEKITGELACQQGPKRQLAIVLDHIVESHPQMNESVQCRVGIAGGKASITGNFSEKEAKNLGLILRYGALPVALEPSTTTLVSATLGKDTLRTGLLAGFVGLALVMLYVLVFYRVLGVVVWVGLAYFSAFTLGVVIILGKTAGFSLTLAGIAGLIVSVGIATDSYIVYYERLKDEVHQGRTVRAAVDRAWDSARRTIVAADLVTGLAAITLYVLAVGSVRGFALMLGLATGLDVFISFLLMHPTVWLLAQTRFFNASKLMGIGHVGGMGATAEPAPVTGGQS
jgi:protein-export membrane protein SecD